MSTNLDKSVAVARRLPKRQKQVLKALGNCCSRKQIARDLKISENTVDSYCKLIYARLGIQSVAQAVRVASMIGLM